MSVLPHKQRKTIKLVSEDMSHISPDNVVLGKRSRTQADHYVDENFYFLMTEDVPPEELFAALEENTDMDLSEGSEQDTPESDNEYVPGKKRKKTKSV